MQPPYELAQQTAQAELLKSVGRRMEIPYEHVGGLL